jgi:hypothetical protein
MHVAVTHARAFLAPNRDFVTSIDSPIAANRLRPAGSAAADHNGYQAKSVSGGGEGMGRARSSLPAISYSVSTPVPNPSHTQARTIPVQS